jgi:RimJ/RimL family protein N-acetyltransferase
MVFRFRSVDIKNDRELLLEFHCRINYESETPEMRKSSYREYRRKWLSTSQPETFLSDLEKSMKDSRTIAEILEDGDSTAGYMWVTFTDLQDYSIAIAGIVGILVAPNYQRKGVAAVMLRRTEELSKERGATLLRSETGIENVASQKLHESFGFKPYRICYEKILACAH